MYACSSRCRSDNVSESDRTSFSISCQVRLASDPRYHVAVTSSCKSAGETEQWLVCGPYLVRSCAMAAEETTRLFEEARDGTPVALDALYTRAAAKLLPLIRLRMGGALRADI